jgi:hypothetical protein
MSKACHRRSTIEHDPGSEGEKALIYEGDGCYGLLHSAMFAKTIDFFRPIGENNGPHIFLSLCSSRLG